MVDVNAKPTDAWTWAHVASGTAAGAAVYEVVEYAHEWPKGSILFGSKRPESGVNVAVDLAVFAAGWWLGRKVR